MPKAMLGFHRLLIADSEHGSGLVTHDGVGQVAIGIHSPFGKLCLPLQCAATRFHVVLVNSPKDDAM